MLWLVEKIMLVLIQSYLKICLFTASSALDTCIKSCLFNEMN